VLIGFGLQIRNVYNSPVEDGTSDDKPTHHGQRTLGNRPMMGDEKEIAAVDQINRRVICGGSSAVRLSSGRAPR
jgi:hypothetical protein